MSVHHIRGGIPAMPGYWQHETGGRLRPAVMAYLEHKPLDPAQIAVLRAYLRQWIMAPAWRGPEIDELRHRVDDLTSVTAINRWLYDAEKEGIDPL